jgi:hypothetical protein
LSNVTQDTVGQEVSLRVIGTQIPPAKMSVQIAIQGTARVQMQGRLHKQAPWVDVGPPCEKSCLLYIDPILSVRAVSSGMGPDSSVSVWAAWTI